MYKVFIENTPIYFEKGEESFPMVLKKYLPSLNTSNYEEFLSSICAHQGTRLVVQSENPRLSLLTFFKDFTRIGAAGGLVFHPTKKAYLFIIREGKWDLPKGKIEKNESLEIAALREVEEECGISNLTLKESILTTYHIFHKYGKHVLKSTDWFYMEYNGNENLTPQIEEGITAVEWLSKDDFSKVFENTYGNIIDVINSIEIK